MTYTLANASIKVQNSLKALNIHATIRIFPESTRTSVDAANCIGCRLAQIAKSLIFKTKESNKPILILASGVNRVNEKSIKKEVGEKIVKADAAFTREKTGFAIGGIPPVGHKEPIELVFIDEDLLEFDTVWSAGGTPNTVFPINPKELARVAGAKVIQVK